MIITSVPNINTLKPESNKIKAIQILFQAMKEVSDLLGLDKDLDNVIDTYREIVAFLDSVGDTTLNNILKNFIRNTDQDIKKECVITESDYENLSEYDANTIYNIIEDSND